MSGRNVYESSLFLLIIIRSGRLAEMYMKVLFFFLNYKVWSSGRNVYESSLFCLLIIIRSGRLAEMYMKVLFFFFVDYYKVWSSGRNV